MGFGESIAAMASSIKGNHALAQRKKSPRQKYREFEVAANKQSLDYKSSMSAEDKQALEQN